MWRDLSPSLLLFLRWVWQPVFFLWWYAEYTVMTRDDSPLCTLKRSLELDELKLMILYPSFWSVLSVQLYLKASHICTEWITRLDVVWRVFCFESLLLFIIPTARRVCSYPGRAGLSTMLGFEVCYLTCLAFFWNYFLYFSFLYFSCCNFFLFFCSEASHLCVEEAR